MNRRSIRTSILKRRPGCTVLLVDILESSAAAIQLSPRHEFIAGNIRVSFARPVETACPRSMAKRYYYPRAYESLLLHALSGLRRI